MERSQTRTESALIASVHGQVLRRSGRGHMLGYPTVNLAAPIDLPTGVYAGFVWIGEQAYAAAIFVGTVALFNQTQPQLEAHLLDFSGDLYDRDITVDLVQKIREVEQFTNVTTLQQAIKQDIISVKQCLAGLSKPN